MYSMPVITKSVRCCINHRRTAGRLTVLVAISCLIIQCVRHALPLQRSLFTSTARKQFLSNFTPFEVLVTAADRDRMISLLDVLTSTLEAAHIDYFMIFGTLLGSYRHHGFIPWDDDMDLMMSARDKPKVAKTLGALAPNYSIRTCFDCKLTERSCSAIRCNWRFMLQSDRRAAGWPFVDLFFYKENVTHFWNDWIWAENEFWSKKSVFPLRRRPFDGLKLLAPCDAAAALSAAKINVSNCVSSRTDHRRRVQFDPSRSVTLPCSTLYDLYPFVRNRSVVRSRSTGDKHITETLVHNNSQLQEIALDIGC